MIDVVDHLGTVRPQIGAPLAARFQPPSLIPHSRYMLGQTVDYSNRVQAAFAEQIASDGPQNFAKFMEASLFSGRDGYYTGGNVQIGEEIGADHFPTAATASPVFGAFIGTAVARLWRSMGCPENFQVVEMGPGEGHLAKSTLEFLKASEIKLYETMKYRLVERSPALLERQRARLCAFSNVEFTEDSALNFKTAPIDGIFISNELPDAFAIERVTLVDGKPLMAYLTIENCQWIEEWRPLTPEIATFIRRFGIELKEGSETPISTSSAEWMNNVCTNLGRGGVLSIDYGSYNYISSPGDECIKVYGTKDKTTKLDKRVVPLAIRDAGKIDMTAGVSFRVLEDVAEECGLRTSFLGNAQGFYLKLGPASVFNSLCSCYEPRDADLNSVEEFKRQYIWRSFNRNFGTDMCLFSTKGVKLASNFWEAGDNLVPKIDRHPVDVLRSVDKLRSKPALARYIESVGFWPGY